MASEYIGMDYYREYYRALNSACSYGTNMSRTFSPIGSKYAPSFGVNGRNKNGFPDNGGGGLVDMHSLRLGVSQDRTPN
ncbi:hypothetical protein FACS18948_5920 [Clostridia bacterium]|nr:hypothetical protein FACS18948_5920 [Clostridia bacterium]